jgi:hypothetical protein
MTFLVFLAGIFQPFL